MSHRTALDRQVYQRVEAQIRCAQIREARATSPEKIEKPSLGQALRDLIETPTLACEANGLKA